MKNLIPFLVLLFGSACCGQQKLISWSDLSGTWMNQRYADILKTTRSPKAAYYPKGLVVPYCEIYESGIQWGIHDGTGIPVSRLDPTNNQNEFRLIGLDNQPTKNLFVLNPTDSLHKLTWIGLPTNGADTAQVFFRLEDSLAHLCNQLVIAGKYRDAHGRQYEFTRDGLANWPDKQFRYEIGLDYTFDGPDYIINLSDLNSKRDGFVLYGFRWDKSTLKLYHQKPNGPDEGERLLLQPQPFLMLKPE